MTPHPPAAESTVAPVLTVARGSATAEEMAALVAVLAARRPRSGTTPQARPGDTASRSAWSDRSRLMRTPLTPGPSAWHHSALPAES